MSGMSLDGIGGFPTQGIVDKLVALERRRETPLLDRQHDLKQQVSALQNLNAKVSSITTNAMAVLGQKDKFSKVDTDSVWNAAKGTSSNETVTVNAKAGAQVGTLTFDVDQVAKSKQALVRGANLQDLQGKLAVQQPPTLSIVIGTKIVTVHPTTGDAQDMAKAINAARESGVTATAVRVGDGQYALQITGTTTGAQGGDFQLYVGDMNQALTAQGVHASTTENDAKSKFTLSSYAQDDLTAHLPALEHSFSKVNLEVTRQASDAQITLWKGSSSQVTLTSDSNTFKDVMDAVDITIGNSAKDKDGKTINPVVQEVTVGVTSDTDKAADGIRKLTGSINLVIDEIASRTAPVTVTREDGTTFQKPGVLGTNPTTQLLRDQLTNLMAGGAKLADGSTVSLSEFGVKLVDAGSGKLHLDFDKGQFAAAMDKDPARARQALTVFASAAEKLGDAYSSAADGLLTQNIKAHESDKTSVSDQIGEFDRRIEQRTASLKDQFSRLQVILQRNQAQMAWLQGQLASLQPRS